MPVKAHIVGTVGFRAPEVTKQKDYNELVDIFSAGVILFIMLTGQRPFSRVLEGVEQPQQHQQHQQQQPIYQQNKQYSLLLSNIKPYWGKYIGYNIIVDGDAKQLLLKMLQFDPRRRILTNSIFKDKWYNGKFLQNGSQLQEHIESLLLQSSNKQHYLVHMGHNSYESISTVSHHNSIE